MRFELAGNLIIPEPVVVTFTDPGTHQLDVPYYIGLGYTDFDVICIGGGGGRGGGINTNNTGTLVRNYGGAGGGGGFCRVQGKLEALPHPDELNQVVVGAGGALGADSVSTPGSTTDGGPGGTSSFAINICRASGGQGGLRAATNSVTVSSGANGGDGGIGDSTAPGGGGIGGVAGVPTATGVDSTPGENGLDGVIVWANNFQSIGQGGGGGAGGIAKYGSGGITCMAGSAGGRGAYNPGDLAVYGPGDLPSQDPQTTADDVFPGSAGGAKATPLNGLPYDYGKSCQSDDPLFDSEEDPLTAAEVAALGRGAVVIRLTVQD